MDVLALLLEADADRDMAETSFEGFTALTAAADGGHVEVVRFLVE